jgi:hypothetical protein
MAIVRLEALRELEKLIVCAIPELKGKVCVGQQGAGHDLAFPHLTLDPTKMRYVPDQADESAEPAPNTVVMNVGRHEGILQIRIGAASLFQRYELEQKVIDLFLETPLHPGIIFSQVTSCPTLGQFTAAWELDEDEWQDMAAFSNQFYSMITCLAIIPALVTRREAYTIKQLQLGLTHDFNTAFDEVSFNDDPPVEVVQINQDGSITAVP